MPDLQLQRILDLIELQKYDLAIREARQVLKSDPKNADALYYIAWSQGKLKKVNDAFKTGKMALQINPEHVYAHILMGILFDSIHKFKQARSHFEKALQLAPSDVNVSVNYAYHLYSCFQVKNPTQIIFPYTPLWREWDDGVKSVEQVLKLNPNHAGAYRLRALWLKRNHKYADARQDLFTALKIAPNDPDNHATLGEIYLAEYQETKAFAAYREALRLAPNDAETRRGLVRALAARTPWIGLLWRWGLGSPSGCRGIFLPVLLFCILPFMCALVANRSDLLLAYAIFILIFMVLLNTVGTYLLTQAVLNGWIKI